MPATREQLAKEVWTLVHEGIQLHDGEFKEQPSKPAVRKRRAKEDPPETQQVAPLPLQVTYQSWYTRALPVVKVILPDRFVEFIEQYRLDKRKEIDFLTYTISDYLLGLKVTRGGEEVVNSRGAFSAKFQKQIFILRSCADRLGSALSDIEGTLRAELFDDELSAAADLAKKGHLRAAGALAGVTLERHLATVAKRHGITFTKKDPTIADYNEALKKENVLDVPNWRFIQRLGDVRNLSVHHKERNPTKDEVDELIGGVQKTVKTLF